MQILSASLAANLEADAFAISPSLPAAFCQTVLVSQSFRNDLLNVSSFLTSDAFVQPLERAVEVGELALKLRFERFGEQRAELHPRLHASSN